MVPKFLKPFALRLLTSRRYRTCTRHGVRYQIDLQELIDFSTYYKGGWENDTIAFLRKTIRPGDTILEAGANVGAHTLLLGKLAGPKGHVYAFEPTQYAANKLRANLALNPAIQNVTLRTEMVTDGAHQLPLLEIKSSWPMSNPQRAPERVGQSAISVDEFVQSQALGRLNLLKVDVDGYDCKVLRGAEHSIRRLRPVILVELCEYTLTAQGDSLQQLFQYLSDLGYRSYSLKGEPITLPQVQAKVGMTDSMNGVFRPQ